MKRSKIARRVPFFTRTEFVKGTSILFADRFNECESETKALGSFSWVDYPVWKSETSLGGKNDRKRFFGYLVRFLVVPAQISQGNGNGSKWIVGERTTNATGQKWHGGELS